MKLDTTTLLILAGLAVGGWYFFVKKPADEKDKAQLPPGATGSPIPGAPAGSGLTETQQVLGGTADIITASGTAVSGILQNIWPD